MNKDLPSYEEIPIALEMPENVRKAYEKAENILQKILRSCLLYTSPSPRD